MQGTTLVWKSKSGKGKAAAAGRAVVCQATGFDPLAVRSAADRRACSNESKALLCFLNLWAKSLDTFTEIEYTIAQHPTSLVCPGRLAAAVGDGENGYSTDNEEPAEFEVEI